VDPDQINDHCQDKEEIQMDIVFKPPKVYLGAITLNCQVPTWVADTEYCCVVPRLLGMSQTSGPSPGSRRHPEYGTSPCRRLLDDRV
jgi:hypothetical protein